MSTPDLRADRPIPDTADLRLLAELYNNDSIPLVNAAWNAQMSQAEAALRLVSMAERGLPLRLVADGDRRALWQIAQSGPATGATPSAPVGVPAAPVPHPASVPAPPSGAHPAGAHPAPHSGAYAAPHSGAYPVPHGGPAVPHGGYSVPEAHTLQQQHPGLAAPGHPGHPGEQHQPPYAQPQYSAPQYAAPQYSDPAHPVGGSTLPPAEPVSGSETVPPPSPVPPHEQAIAGAVPLGEPPFGNPVHTSEAEYAPPVRNDDSAAATASPDIGSDIAHAEAQAETPESNAPASGAEADDVEPPAATDAAPRDESAESADKPADESAEPANGDLEPAAATDANYGPSWQTHTVHGPAGEAVQVGLLAVIDPADTLAAAGGLAGPPGYRAVLVHSTVINVGQVALQIPGDHNLVVETDEHVLLGRVHNSLASHPAYPAAVPPGVTVDGWSLFHVPVGTTIAGFKWCIRPDVPQTIIGWPARS